MNRIYLLLSLTLVMGACCSTSSSRPESQTEVVAALEEGNARFVAGKATTINEAADYAATLVAGQHPFATVVACSDSRVPVELIFDQGFGDLFVIRNAGNTVLDPISLGSVEYSVNHLGVNTVVVLGHTSCGAITGVVNSGDEHAHHIEGDQSVEQLLDHIASHIPQHKGTHANLDEAILDNIEVQIEAMLLSENLAQKVGAGELQILAALYDIASGEVRFLD